MDIKVDKHRPGDGSLVFTITVTDAHEWGCAKGDVTIMRLLEECKKQVWSTPLEAEETKQDVAALMHEAKFKTFNRVLNNLRFAIENELRPKFKPICQEIYNWIQDNQIDELKTWMMEVDPQRTTYYFDNDENAHKYSAPQMSEHEEEEDDE
jgi:hypothetical protein